MAEKVWIRLFIHGEGISGEAFEIDHVPNNVSDLKRVVAKEREGDIWRCHYSKLLVYQAGKEFPPKEADQLSPGEPVPKDTTAEKPLRVVAPANESLSVGKNISCFLRRPFESRAN